MLQLTQLITILTLMLLGSLDLLSLAYASCHSIDRHKHLTFGRCQPHAQTQSSYVRSRGVNFVLILHSCGLHHV